MCRQAAMFFQPAEQSLDNVALQVLGAHQNEVTETTLAVTSKKPIIKEQYPKKKSISFHTQHDLTQKAPLHPRPPSAHKEAIPESHSLKFLAGSH